MNALVFSGIGMQQCYYQNEQGVGGKMIQKIDWRQCVLVIIIFEGNKGPIFIMLKPSNVMHQWLDVVILVPYLLPPARYLKSFRCRYNFACLALEMIFTSFTAKKVCVITWQCDQIWFLANFCTCFGNFMLLSKCSLIQTSKDWKII